MELYLLFLVCLHEIKRGTLHLHLPFLLPCLIRWQSDAGCLFYGLTGYRRRLVLFSTSVVHNLHRQDIIDRVFQKELYNFESL
jgi:hypothetical protein